VAAWPKAWTVFAISNAGIVGSNPTQGMDFCIVCIHSFVVLFCLYVGAFRPADPPAKESYWLCIESRNWKSSQGPEKGCRAALSNAAPTGAMAPAMYFSGALRKHI
jgi:hypothetical protein